MECHGLQWRHHNELEGPTQATEGSHSLNDRLVGLTAQSACVGVSALTILFHSCLPASVPERLESATCAGSMLMLTGAVVAVLNVTRRAAPVVARVALTAWRRGREAHCKCSVESNCLDCVGEHASNVQSGSVNVNRANSRFLPSQQIPW